MNLLIVDTDILSMFAKVGAIEVFIALVGQEAIRMTPAIADEITIPLQYGYLFPRDVLSKIPVVPLSPQVMEQTAQLRLKNTSLGRGEREAIAFCQIEVAWFTTNDNLARKFAQSQGVQVISLQSLLRAIWLSGVKSQTEVRILLEQIKQVDKLKISAKVEKDIFG
jgi:predicted nucleic acid-binding protein